MLTDTLAHLSADICNLLRSPGAQVLVLLTFFAAACFVVEWVCR